MAEKFNRLLYLAIQKLLDRLLNDGTLTHFQIQKIYGEKENPVYKINFSGYPLGSEENHTLITVDCHTTALKLLSTIKRVHSVMGGASKAAVTSPRPVELLEEKSDDGGN